MYVQLAQCLKDFITVHWIICESSTIHQQNHQNFYHYITFHFILESVLIHNQLMSTKKQLSSLCKLYSVYGEKPEEILDKTDVDSYFYHIILDILQSHHRIVRVSKGSNKKSFAFKVFHFQD